MGQKKFGQASRSYNTLDKYVGKLILTSLIIQYPGVVMVGLSKWATGVSVYKGIPICKNWGGGGF